MNKHKLLQMYLNKKMSVAEIATFFHCSQNKINYWFTKYNIPKRSISDATYTKRNPQGDPFRFVLSQTKEQAFLYGLGLGLYWGEGNKRNQSSVRLGNTDPRLVKKFIEFLIRVYQVEKRKFRFGLQIFSDMNPKEATAFWQSFLGFSSEYFMKTIVTPARSLGTYREKTKHGVLTVYVSNKKLRDLICRQIEIL